MSLEHLEYDKGSCERTDRLRLKQCSAKNMLHSELLDKRWEGIYDKER